MNREASWKNELEIMYRGLASKGYIWMEHEEEKKVEAALAKDPENYYLLTAKGILNFNYNWDVAIECFSKALAQRPFDAHQHYNRGRKYLSCDRIPEAAADLILAIQLDPSDNWKWHYVGVVKYLQRKYEESIYYCKKAMEVSEAHNKDLYCCEVDWIWTALCHLGRYDEAKALVETVDHDTPIVPVIGDDEGYKNVCLLCNEKMTLEEFLERIGPQNEGGSVNELYGVAKYFYYVKKNLKLALEYLHKTMTFKERSGAWGYKMAAMDKETWEAEYAASLVSK
jgi:tetratricopeptide (TPR) repeat protein